MLPTLKNTLQGAVCAALSGLVLTSSVLAQDVPARTRITDIYSEGAYFNRIDSTAGLLVTRFGAAWNRVHLETYGTIRIGADARTLLDTTNGVFNDNFLFVGVGVDAVSLLPGLRLTAQVGHSYDLTSKIDRAGFDYRTGAQTYHEILWPVPNLFSEIYSEFFYIRRYRDAYGALQLRTGHNSWVKETAKGHRIELAPLVNGIFAIDTRALDYNRFVEVGFGPRLTYRWPGTMSLSLRPFYVLGARWERPTTLPTYDDFRVLLTAFIAF